MPQSQVHVPDRLSHTTGTARAAVVRRHIQLAGVHVGFVRGLGNRAQASGASQPAGSVSEVHRRLPWLVLSMYICPLQYEWSLP